MDGGSQPPVTGLQTPLDYGAELRVNLVSDPSRLLADRSGRHSLPSRQPVQFVTAHEFTARAGNESQDEFDCLATQHQPLVGTREAYRAA